MVATAGPFRSSERNSHVTPRPEGLSTDAVGVQFGAVAALRDVSVTFPDKTISGLIGPNGAGKTTLLNVISGFQAATSGSVHLNGRSLESSGIRGRVDTGVVRTFQTVRLLEGETVFDNIALGCERLGGHSVVSQIVGLPRGRAARRRDRENTEHAIELLGLESVVRRAPKELPYAQCRLVEIARALAGRPQVLLLDEPMAGMDTDARHALLASLQRVHAELGMTMVVVEHDIEMVRRLCGHAVMLASGTSVTSGTPADVVADPRVQEAYFGSRRD